MEELMKIRDVSTKYEISARTLRYYEDIGLIRSIRNEDYAYRTYDQTALKRLEQILVLRKLGISIKEIQQIFQSKGSEIVLDILSKKVTDIDNEVALLHELKSIVMEFIRQIEDMDFESASDIKLLYGMAKGVESWIAESNSSEVEIVDSTQEKETKEMDKLSEVSSKLSRIPQVRIVSIPKCRMATSGEPDNTFSRVWSFDSWWPEYDAKRHMPSYAALDFLFECQGGLVWGNIVEDDATSADCGGYEVIDFEGGLYAVHASVDTDTEIGSLVCEKMVNWLKDTGFEVDKTRPIMGHMINPSEEIRKAIGYDQYEIYMPIKSREDQK